MVSLSMPTVNTKEMITLIKDTYLATYRTPVGKRKKFLPLHFIGMPGLGKTAGFVQACVEIAKELNREFIHQPTMDQYMNADPNKIFVGNDIRISQMSSLDVRGLVARSSVDSNRMTWLAPEWLPTRDGLVGINFFDEIQLGRPEVQAATYQIINERMIGNLRLADDIMQIAASNPTRAGGLNYGIPPALANRFMHIEVIQDAETFIEWAAMNDVHPFVRAFISWQNADLLVFPENPEQLSFPSPRTWEMVSFCMNMTNTATRNKLINSAIGAEHSTKFITYVEQLDQLPDPSTVLVDGKMFYPERRDYIYAMVESLVSAVKDDPKHIPNFITWVMNNKITADLQAYAFKMVIQLDKKFVIRHPDFMVQVRKNPRLSQVLTGAVVI